MIVFCRKNILEIALWRSYIEWDWPLLPFPSTNTTLVGGRDPQWKHYYSYLLSQLAHLCWLSTFTGRKQTRWECNYTLSLCHKPAVAWMWKHGSQLSTPDFYDSFFMNVHNPGEKFWLRFYILVIGIWFPFTSHILFPYSFLDFYFPFLFGLLFPFSIWTFISIFSLDFNSF